MVRREYDVMKERVTPRMKRLRHERKDDVKKGRFVIKGKKTKKRILSKIPVIKMTKNNV